MDKGHGILIVEASAIALALAHLPRTYEVVGSEQSVLPGTVRLVLASDDIAPGPVVSLTMEIEDKGSMRTVTLRGQARAGGPAVEHVAYSAPAAAPMPLTGRLTPR